MSPKGQERTHKKDKTGSADARDAKGRFIPGYCGGGRPAVARDFRERCQNFMAAEGWALLEADARRPGHAGHQARELIAAYAYGKPKQGIELAGSEGGELKIVVEYVRAAPSVG